MRLPALAVLALVLLAGCSADPGTDATDPADDIDFGDVKATDTTGVIRGLVVDGTVRPLQQRTDAYIHNFYNFVPPAGWRFTVDGDPVVPDE
jgi:hypothetical protein